MAKLGLLFIAVFCAVQLSMAGRVVRDTDATTLPSIDLEAVKGKIQDVGTQISDTVAKIFTQENLDKLWTGVQDAGKKISEVTQEAGKNIKDKVDELTKEAEVKQ